MDDFGKSRDELIQELRELRERVANLGQSTRGALVDRVEHGSIDQGEVARPSEDVAGDCERRFRTVFCQSPIGIGLIDLQGRIIAANRAMEEIFGYLPGELSGRDALKVGDWNDPKSMESSLQILAAGEKDRFDMEQCNLGKNDQAVWVRLSVALVRNASGQPQFIIATAVDITRRKKADDAVREEQHMLRQLIELQEHDRRMLGYEIHDGFAQYLSGAVFLFQAYEQLRGTDPDEAAKTFQGAMRLLDQSHQETRRLVSGLRPLVLDESGIVAGIHNLLEEAQQRGGVEAEFVHTGSVNRLPTLTENAIFRIVQESLNNAIQHSNSRRIRVELSQQDVCLRVEIRDWGGGFDPEKVGQGHYGLEGIRERARLLGGTATIHSEVGSGTSVLVEIPIGG